MNDFVLLILAAWVIGPLIVVMVAMVQAAVAVMRCLPYLPGMMIDAVASMTRWVRNRWNSNF